MVAQAGVPCEASRGTAAIIGESSAEDGVGSKVGNDGGLSRIIYQSIYTQTTRQIVQPADNALQDIAHPPSQFQNASAPVHIAFHPGDCGRVSQ